MVGTTAGAIQDPTRHPAQQEVDRPPQFWHPTDGDAGGAGDLREPAGFPEPTRVHRSGERLEVRLSRQVVVVAVESLGGPEQLRCGFTRRERTCLTTAAADEFHLCAHPGDLGPLTRGQRPQFGYREKLVRRVGRGRIALGLRGRNRPCSPQVRVRRQHRRAFQEGGCGGHTAPA
ncbi:MAG: hypothetical protein ACRDUB_19515, partial [Mycobacterium sp.]